MQLLKGDCLEVMKTLPDKSVDLFVCDLPYGCLTGGAGKDGGCAWDIPIDLPQFWVQVKRLAKDDHTPVLMFCSTKFGYELIKSNESWFRYDLVWSKNRGVGFLCANKMPMRSHENIYVFAKKGARYYRKDIEGDFPASHYSNHKRSATSNVVPRVADLGDDTGVPVREGVRCVKSVINASASLKKGKHPTQKPDDLYAWLIQRYSKEGDTVLDPTAGSFASVFTAERMGRIGIGIEKDEAFYESARLRMPVRMG